MIETPATHVATFATADAFGPRSGRIDQASARGRINVVGGVLGCSTRCASMLCRNALVRSAFAASMVTPGFRRAIVDIHPQLYVVHQVRPLLELNPVPAA